MASGASLSGYVRSMTGRDLAGFDEFRQDDEVLAADLGEEHEQPLAHEPGHRGRSRRLKRRPEQSAASLIEHGEQHLTSAVEGDEFEFGLGLILDGLKRMRDSSPDYPA
jgi:hypothetical protein